MSIAWQILFFAAGFLGLAVGACVVGTGKQLCCFYHYFAKVIGCGVLGLLIMCTIYGLCNVIVQLAS